MADYTIQGDTSIDTSGAQRGLNKLSAKGRSSMSGIGKAAGIAKVGIAAIGAAGIAATVAMGGVAKAAITYNATMQDYTTQFGVMLGSQKKAIELVNKLQKIAASTPFELTDIVETTKLLMNYGLTAEESTKKMMMLGDIAQGNADKMNRIATAYGQMSSAGKVSLEDVKQMIEAGFSPLKEISESTGESMKSLYKRISAGKVSVNEITASMERSTAAGGKYFGSMEAQSKTFNGQLSTLKDNTMQLLGGAFSGVFAMLNTKILPQANAAIATLSEAFKKGGMSGMLQAGKEMIVNFIGGIDGGTDGLMKKAVSIVKGVLTSFMSAAPSILEFAYGLVASLATQIGNAAPEMLTAAVTLITTLADKIVTMVPKMFEAKMNLFEKLGDGIVANIPKLVEKIPEVLGALLVMIAKYWPRMIAAGAILIVKIAFGLVKAIPTLLMKIPGLIWDIAKAIGTAAVELVAAGFDIIAQLFIGMWNFFSGKQNDETLKMVDSFVASLKEFAPKVLALGGWLVRTIISGIKGAWSLIGKSASWIVSKLKNGFYSALSSITSIGSWILDKVIYGIKAYWTIVSTIGSWIVSKLKGAFSATIEAVSGIGSWIFKKIIAGIKAYWSIASGIGAWIIGKIISSMSGLVEEFKKIGSKIVGGIWSGIKGSWSTIKNGVGNLIDGIGNFFSGGSSSKGASVGKSFSKSMSVGVEKNASALYNSIKKVAGKAAIIATDSLNGVYAGASASVPVRASMTSAQVAMGKAQSAQITQINNFNQPIKTTFDASLQLKNAANYGLARSL